MQQLSNPENSVCVCLCLSAGRGSCLRESHNHAPEGSNEPNKYGNSMPYHSVILFIYIYAYIYMYMYIRIYVYIYI